MGLKDLFKSKAVKGKPDPRIRWFGKLPSYPDYYSSQADEEWAVEFNDWVLKGFELYRNRLANDGKRGSPLPISGGVVRLPKSGMTVFASVLDFGGDMRGRPFPMCFYVGLPTGQWPGPTSDRLVGAYRVIRELVAMRREIPRFLNSPGRFDATFGNRQLGLDGIDANSSDESWQAAAKAIALSQWFEAARAGIKEGSWSAWLRLATAFGENVAKHESDAFGPTFRFPLAMRFAIDAQVSGWLHWLGGRMDLKRRALSLIVTGEPGDAWGSVSIVARDIVPDDFLLATPLASALPYVDDLCRASAGEGEASAGASSNGEDASATFVDFARGAVRVP